MPTKCSVKGCDNYYSKGVPFFDVPSPLKYKFSSEKAMLSKKRRKLWLQAMRITQDINEILRICSKHFVTGKPASLEDIDDVDWVPTLHMKLSLPQDRQRRNDRVNEKRKDSSKSSHSSKENAGTSKRHRSSSSRGTKTRDFSTLKKKKVICTALVGDMESGINSKKIDFKKFLNCKVVLDGNIQCATFKGTNGSGLTITQKHGSFTSDNVTVKETAINNTVLRIHLIKEDLHGLKRKYKSLSSSSTNRKRRKDQEVSSFGRQIKRKSYHFENALTRTPVRNVVGDKSSVLKSTKSERKMRDQNEDKHTFNDFSEELPSKPKVMKTVIENAKTLNKIIKKNYRDKIKIKLYPRTPTPIRRAVKNGAVRLTADESLQLKREIFFVQNLNEQYNLDKTYFLKFRSYRCPDDGTLSYSFQKLVTDVKHMKLPAPSWKIKVIIRQGKIAAITFTNKSTLERCVGFSANSNKYKVTIDNKPALLLGSPEYVKTSEDLEILLDIIQNIDSKNPMVFYK